MRPPAADLNFQVKKTRLAGLEASSAVRGLASIIRAAACVLLAALATAPSAVRACGYHDPSSASLGMLNWAYPDSLHVRTAVWRAQGDGALARLDEGDALAPGSPEYLLRQMQRFRRTEAQLRALHEGLARERQTPPPFAVVLLGSMLWSRFETNGGAPTIAVHADGPASGDVVIVTDAPVVAAIVDGRLAPRAARAGGLMRLYGEPAAVDRVAAALDKLEVHSMTSSSTTTEGARR